MIKFLIFLFIPIFLSAKLQVITYFPLETSIIKKIAKDEVKIKEITYKFNSDIKAQEIPFSQISKLSNAKVYFHLGLDVENIYAKLLKDRNPDIVIVDLSSNIQKIDENPYIWTDPFLLRDIAKNAYETLIQIDKQKINFYKKNYEALLDEIDTTYLRIKQKLITSDLNAVYVFDDYWEYFTKRFRIKTIKREKRFLNVLEVPELVDFTKKKDIRKILFSNNYDYTLALSISSNLNVEMIEDSIFQDNWQTNLLTLTDKLLNQK